MTPDLIADQALILTSQWQREALPTSDEAMLMLYRDQARRWAQQDNISNEQFEARLEAVREEMGL